MPPRRRQSQRRGPSKPTISGDASLERARPGIDIAKTFETERIARGDLPNTYPGLVYDFYRVLITNDWGGEAETGDIEMTALSMAIDRLREIADDARVDDEDGILTSRRTAIHDAAMRYAELEAMMEDPDYYSDPELLIENLRQSVLSSLRVIAAGNAPAMREMARAYAELPEMLKTEISDVAESPEASFFTERFYGGLSNVISHAAEGPSDARGKIRKLLQEIRDPRYDQIATLTSPVTELFRPSDEHPITREILGESNKDVMLDVSILPSDTNLRELAEQIFRESSDAEKSKVDLARVELLAQVRELVGKDRCYFARGKKSGKEAQTADGGTISEDYIILVMQVLASGGGVATEHALAISPIARKHAAYMVRGDVSEDSWRHVLALTKQGAQDAGARRIQFRSFGSELPTETTYKKIDSLLTCSPEDFSGDYLRERSGSYRLVRKSLGSAALQNAGVQAP